MISVINDFLKIRLSLHLNLKDKNGTFLSLRLRNFANPLIFKMIIPIIIFKISQVNLSLKLHIVSLRFSTVPFRSVPPALNMPVLNILNSVLPRAH